MSEPDSYTSHNFDAVNEQIKEIAARERARTNAYRLESYRTAFIYAGAAALIIGLLALLLSWSYRLLNAPYPEEITKVVKPEIIEKEGIKFIHPATFEASLSERKHERKVLFTVDDGLLSFYENAWPILKKKKNSFYIICKY